MLGTSVDAITFRGAIDRVAGWATDGRPSYAIFCTVSSVLSARDNTRVAEAFSSAGLVSPDGMPLVWLGRRRQPQPVERVYGPDFMLAFLEATGGDLSHYFYGGAPGVAEEMAHRLTVRFPGLRVAGIHSPPFTEALPVDPAEVKRLNASGADVVWVGLGHPKQDLWVHAYREHLDAPALMAVGAAFDFHAGAVKEAPAWMKRSGLQWLHRLASDPKRLWRRYLIGNSRFLWLLVIERLKARRA